jgi:NAD+ kinase
LYTGNTTKMPKTIENVGVISKINNIEAERTAISIMDLLTKHKVNVYTITPLSADSFISVTIEQVSKLDLDLIFAIGGDGTTLKAFRIPPYHIPVLSINIGGHKGILSEFGIESLDYLIESVLAGNFYYDCRLRMQAYVNGNISPPALNDILFTRINLTRTPLLSIRIMGDQIKQKMDGIIISTATGSTGHSFSMGGPIMHESLECLLLTPMAPINRLPFIIVPIHEIAIKSSHDGTLIIDGQEAYNVIAGQTIRISRFPIYAHFIRVKKKGVRQLSKLGFT